MTPRQTAGTSGSAADDAELAARVAERDAAAFEALMRRYNGKLFRIARAILKNDADAEDALQEAYLDAYRHMRDFRGSAQLSTWMTRIVINQALMRLRRQKRDHMVVPFARPTDHSDQREVDVVDEHAESPQRTVLRAELRRVIERQIDALPESFRAVFVMREVEDMPVDEIAACLSIPPATVRTRVFRARSLLLEALARDLDVAAVDVFGFAGDRCDRIVAAVLARLDDEGGPDEDLDEPPDPAPA
jgi:RNA polymerase sigma-70 factor (ECF subfamily)